MQSSCALLVVPGPYDLAILVELNGDDYAAFLLEARVLNGLLGEIVKAKLTSVEGGIGDSHIPE